MDSFSRALQRGGSSSKLTSLFKLKMLARPAPQQSPLAGEGYIGSGPAGIATPGVSMAGSVMAGGGAGCGTPGGTLGGGASPGAAGAVSVGGTGLSPEELLMWSNVSERARGRRRAHGSATAPLPNNRRTLQAAGAAPAEQPRRSQPWAHAPARPPARRHRLPTTPATAPILATRRRRPGPARSLSPRRS